MRNFVNLFDLDLGSEKRTEDFTKSLSELVSILFAVIFGVGLEKFRDAQSSLDYAMLIAAYITVLLSWWGYHFGTSKGPREQNTLLFLLDCLIVSDYWFMIEYAFKLDFLLLNYTVLFLLYTLWELVRVVTTQGNGSAVRILRAASYLNALFFIVALALYSYVCECKVPATGFAVILVIVGVLAYRVLIHLVYSHSKERGTN